MKIIKNSLIVFFVFLTVAKVNAQNSEKQVNLLQLPEIPISEGVNLLFISPEPIDFVDLSTNNLVGDLPADNIARVKIRESKDGSEKLNLGDGQESCGVITIVGQSFIAQYRTVYRNITYGNPLTNIQIQPEDMQPLEFPKEQFSSVELRRFTQEIIEKKIDRPLRVEKKFKMSLQLNNAYVLNDYIFLDISMLNKTHLNYNIEDVKFTIEDKKIYKSTNNQTVALTPIYQMFNIAKFRRRYRNIFVFKKFTYPNGKVLKIRVLENPISGRTIELKIKYSDILNADILL